MIEKKTEHTPKAVATEVTALNAAGSESPKASGAKLLKMDCAEVNVLVRLVNAVSIAVVEADEAADEIALAGVESSIRSSVLLSHGGHDILTIGYQVGGKTFQNRNNNGGLTLFRRKRGAYHYAGGCKSHKNCL